MLKVLSPSRVFFSLLRFFSIYIFVHTMHLNLNTRTLNVTKARFFFLFSLRSLVRYEFSRECYCTGLLFVSKFEETILFLDRLIFFCFFFERKCIYGKSNPMIQTVNVFFSIYLDRFATLRIANYLSIKIVHGNGWYCNCTVWNLSLKSGFHTFYENIAS